MKNEEKIIMLEFKNIVLMKDIEYLINIIEKNKIKLNEYEANIIDVIKEIIKIEKI